MSTVDSGGRVPSPALRPRRRRGGVAGPIGGGCGWGGLPSVDTGKVSGVRERTVAVRAWDSRRGTGRTAVGSGRGGAETGGDPVDDEDGRAIVARTSRAACAYRRFTGRPGWAAGGNNPSRRSAASSARPRVPAGATVRGEPTLRRSVGPMTTARSDRLRTADESSLVTSCGRRIAVRCLRLAPPGPAHQPGHPGRGPRPGRRAGSVGGAHRRGGTGPGRPAPRPRGGGRAPCPGGR